jgi:hypothetical protein
MGIMPDQSSAAGKRAKRSGVGLALITVGAILLFALRAGSPHWLNLHTVGAVLIFTGAVGLLAPRRVRSSGGLFRRWVVPNQPAVFDLPQPGETSAVYGDGALLVQGPGYDERGPSLADVILDHEHDPPL